MQFSKLLAESAAILYERDSRMTPPQRKKVADLGKIGWSINSRDEDIIVMKRGHNHLEIQPSGEVLMLEGDKKYDVTDVIDALGG